MFFFAIFFLPFEVQEKINELLQVIVFTTFLYELMEVLTIKCPATKCPETKCPAIKCPACNVFVKQNYLQWSSHNSISCYKMYSSCNL